MSHKLKIELKYTEPKIYRTVIVPEFLTFHDLHNVIQCVMNWEDSHLYQFNLGAPYKSDSVALKNDQDDDLSFIFGRRFEKYDSLNTTISEFFNGQKKSLNYIYDFGDDWIHSIKALKKPTLEVEIPKCITGENAAPIEDCGGVYGFYNLMETLNSKGKSIDKEDMRDLLGLGKKDTYESVYGFDLEKVNKKLAAEFLMYNEE